MKFIEILLQHSQIKEAKLFRPSLKASESPETGITIQNPSAYHVIKDCATLAHKYLPHYVFGHYANPFEVLKGKFTKGDIVDFINGANSDIVLNQLLNLILEKIKKMSGQSSEIKEPTASSAILPSNTADPYGDYESFTTTTHQPQQQDTVTLVCNAFGVV